MSTECSGRLFGFHLLRAAHDQANRGLRGLRVPLMPIEPAEVQFHLPLVGGFELSAGRAYMPFYGLCAPHNFTNLARMHRPP